MNKHTYIFTVFLLAAGIIAGCYLCNMIHAYKAEKAAMRAKFNAIGGTTIQSGTITYRYKLN